MELKKNKKYELEPKRPLFFGIGMVISLSLTLVAFEWKSEIDPIPIFPDEIEDPWTIVIEDPHITKHDIPDIPKPVEQKKIASPLVEVKELTDLLKEDDNKIIDSEPEDLVGSIDFGDETIEVPEDPFIIVEDMPEFPGGEQALMEFLGKNIKYPRRAKSIGIEGRVYLKFIVDVDGSITDIQVMKGIGAGCDEEAIRVLNLLPNFSPGKQRGVPVKVQMQIPVNFKLK